jgi:Domain of unknown function (DUF5666)
MNKIRGFVRSHLGAAIAAVATAVVFVGGILILTLVGGGGGTPAAAGSTTTTTLAPPGSKASRGKGAAQRRQGVRGVITAINGNTWTVTSAAGVPVTVDVTATTTFGTKKLPLMATDFSDGDRIVVLGTRSGTTVTATRITMGAQPGGAATTTTTPSG